jgi:hypothetical protein
VEPKADLDDVEKRKLELYLANKMSCRCAVENERNLRTANLNV